jgi:signal transduction histidine kinase
MHSVLLDKKQEFKSEIKWLRPSGDEYVSEVSISPILGASGEIIFFVGLARDITKLKDVDRMKTEFISLASHQLRTPLSTMSWYVEMLKGEELGKLNAEQMDLVKQIDDSTKRMIDLVGSLLNVSRLESGRIIIEPLRTDFKELSKGVLADLKSKITGKNIKVEEIYDKDLNVILDFRMIRNVVLNLLSNAVKYSPMGSTIKLKAYLKDDRLYCFVKDQGYGIPKKDYSKIFNKFFRASNITKYDTDGNGLGLYLCKSIITASGGEIWFESTLGEGTTFAFWIPMKGIPPKKGEVYLDS